MPFAPLECEIPVGAFFWGILRDVVTCYKGDES